MAGRGFGAKHVGERRTNKDTDEQDVTAGETALIQLKRRNDMALPAERPKFEVMAMQARDAFLKIADEKVWAREIMFAIQILRGSELRS